MYLKYSFLILFYFSLASLTIAQCPTSIFFSSQAAIDNFSTNYPGCTMIPANIIIDGGPFGDINSLNGLSGLTSVGGDLTININPALTSLDGLSGITSIGGALEILSNYALTDLSGLSGLTSVGEDLIIGSNIVLTNLDGLSGLTSVGEDLRIHSNDGLTNLDGLSDISSITGTLDIAFNGSLTDLSALSGLTSVGEDLIIYGNDALINIDGLSGLTFLGRDLYVQNNNALMSLDGLSGLTSVGRNLTITNNPQLNMCCALCPLLQADAINDTVIGGTIDISNNAVGCGEADILACTSCMLCDLVIDTQPTPQTACPGADATFTVATSSGTSPYTYQLQNDCATTGIFADIGPTSTSPMLTVSNVMATDTCDYQIVITDNVGCTTTSDAVALTLCQCPTNITFNTQAEVDNFSANYPGCTMIPGDVIIEYVTDITNLNGLSGITSIGGNLDIYSESLSNLVGLSGLTSIGGNFHITTLSWSLTSLDGISNLNSIGGFLSIEGNYELINVNGLSGLTSVGGDLYIGLNDALTNIDGLSALTSINGSLIIEENGALTSIDGLSSLNSIGGDLYLRHNTQLSICCVLCPLLQAGLIGGNTDISNNAIGCDAADVLVCTPCGLCDLVIDTQPMPQTVCQGVDATFTVATSGGTAPYTYQLQNDCAIIGTFADVGTASTSPMLTVSNVMPTDTCDYQIVITDNAGCTATSDAVALTLCAQCPTNITFSTQAEIDNFPVNYPGCTVIPGNVSISDSGNPLTNLNGLSAITSIGGDFNIYSESLQNLVGLSGLTSIGGNFYISTLTPSLTSLDGISNLTSIGGNLSMEFNDGLTNIDGLSGLTSIGGDLYISANPLLANVDGLSALNSVSGLVFIADYNEALTNIDGLSALTMVGGDLSIGYNTALTNIDGLSGLTTVGGYIGIGANDVLTDVDGLSALTSANGINIGSNPLLTHIVMPNLNSIGPIIISGNAMLTDIQFPGLITTNSNGGLSLNNNPLLTNLDGFSSITSFGAGVYIRNNATLMNVDGLSGLTSIGADLVIENNLQLSMCCALCPLLQADIVDDTVIGGNTNISNNAIGCDEADVLACTFCVLCDLVVDSQPMPQIACPGADASFTVTVSGGVAPYTYQLQNDCSIANDFTDVDTISTSSTLILSNVMATDTCDYRIVVTDNAGCTTTSNAVALTLCQCPTTSIFLSTQMEIDSFPINYPGCTMIPAGVSIFINDAVSGDITNLDGLSGLTSIGGDLYINFNDALTNIDGLSGLTSVGGNLTISNNAQLDMCCALCHLLHADDVDDTVVGGNISINNNAIGCDEANIKACASCEVCFDNLTLNPLEVGSENYTVSNSIISTDTIISGEDVIYDAGNIIELQNGFSVDANANLSILTEGCTID